jgi:hypothetical protein
MDPDFAELASELSDFPFSWIVFCPTENSQIGDSFSDQSDAADAAASHNQETGHSSSAVPGFQAADGQLSTGVQLVSFPFCIRFNGRPWQSIVLSAPSPELAAQTLSSILAILNRAAGAPQFTATTDLCPS